MQRRPSLFLVALVLALGIAGCGSDGGSTTASPTKAEFIKQADAICRAADEAQLPALAKAEKQASGESNAARTAVMLMAGLEPIEKEAKEIAALAVPEGDGDQLEAIVDGIESAVEEVEAKGSKGSSAFVTVNRLSAQYGFRACSEVE